MDESIDIKKGYSKYKKFLLDSILILFIAGICLLTVAYTIHKANQYNQELLDYYSANCLRLLTESQAIQKNPTTFNLQYITGGNNNESANIFGQSQSQTCNELRGCQNQT